MSLESAVSCVDRALASNPNCSAGLVAQKRVIGIPKGPSAGPEILAILHVDDPCFGCWYGHVLSHPQANGRFVSLIVWSSVFINAPTVPLLFQRFHYWIKDRLEYHPCCVQNADDAYFESDSIEDAAVALSRMIMRFDIDKRRGDDDSQYAVSPPELRIISIYGLKGAVEANGSPPPIPMPNKLTLVNNQE
jgi:hypothetical protein